MKAFHYVRASSVPEALAAAGEDPTHAPAFLAGGTCLLDLMKQGVEAPERIIDLSYAEDLREVWAVSDGGLEIGAMATLAQVARHPEAARRAPLLISSLRQGLTPQLRNAATFGGAVSQRPRCIYFREPGFACNKRTPSAGCAAKGGVHFAHALYGGAAAETCVAVHPSDLCTALVALDAQVRLQAPGRARTLALDDYLRLPGEDPTRETERRPGELVTAITVPTQGTRGGAYVKAPEEGFALAACAVVIGLVEGRISEVRVVLGGVAHKPWRSPAAEAALLGRTPGPEPLAAATQALLAEARTDSQTSFRLPLIAAVFAEALAAATDDARRHG